MVSRIDPQFPRDDVPASKAELRRNLEAAKAEIEHGGFYAPEWRGALARTVLDKLGDGLLSISDFGALGDGSGATIAEWLTGGAHDRGYDDLAAIQSDFPEATTLEATIDSVAMLRAINLGLEQGRDVLIPNGIFVIDPAARPLDVTLSGGGSLTIKGLGRNSVIRRKDGTSTSNFARLLETVTEAGGFGYLEICNLTIDSNARNNPTPAGDDWAFEHSADIFLNATASAPIGCVRFANLYLLDAMADHLSVGNEEGEGVTVGCAIFEQIVARRRTRPRADIIVYNGCELTLMSNLDVEQIEVEFNEPPLQRVHIYAQNVRTRILDLAGDGPDDRIFFFCGVNLEVTQQADLYGMSATISNSRLRLHEGGRIINIGDLRVTDCDLLLPFPQDQREVVPVTLEHREDGAPRISFVRCRFIVDAGPEVRAITGYAVASNSAVAAGGTALPEVVFEACEFDPRLEGCLSAYRAGIWRSRSCHFSCRGSAVRVTTSEGYLQHYTSDNDDFSGVQGAPFLIGSGETGTENCKLVLCHALMPMRTQAFEIENSGWEDVVLESSRVLLVEGGAPRGGGIAGDRARLRRPVPGQVYEWVCIDSHPTEASWAPVVRL
jgi:hypothetical protein